jgi:hypothetical protein
MAIVNLPTSPDTSPTCAICKVKLLLDKATAGFLDHQGHQAFACVSHFSEVEKLISGWADYLADERITYLQQGQQPQNVMFGSCTI